MQHIVVEIRQGDATTVTRICRLFPNCHLLGISTELGDWMIQTLVKARKEDIVRYLRDAVSTQGRTARRLCLSSITNSAYFKFYSQSPVFKVPLSWTLLMLQFFLFTFPLLFLLHASTLLLLSSPLLLSCPPFCFFFLAPCLLCASLPLCSFGSFFA